ncbi:uncharacterized protein LOC129756768 [Uranotaenia lowii]|uniref:uncharacterized protein LOC129756768 n=1 Tax=Uranotaenia lowii TaxID=190385 RepID=UPI00247A551E|nr:uncharacterized protein LOC129756768 [Uranotaenia lowii]
MTKSSVLRVMRTKPSYFERPQLPIRCCVPNCTTVARSVRQYFTFVPKDPPFRRNTTKSQKELYQKRFYYWLRVLGLEEKDYSKKLKICSSHFVKGRPSGVYECGHEDWIPSKNLPNNIRCRIVTLLCVDTKLEPISPGDTDSERPEAAQVMTLENSFCSLCLKEDDRIRPLFPCDIDCAFRIQLINSLTGVALDCESNFNCFICVSCDENLKLFQNWRDNVQQNNRFLKEQDQGRPVPLVSIPLEQCMEISAMGITAPTGTSDDFLSVAKIEPEEDESNQISQTTSSGIPEMVIENIQVKAESTTSVVSGIGSDDLSSAHERTKSISYIANDGETILIDQTDTTITEPQMHESCCKGELNIIEEPTIEVSTAWNESNAIHSNCVIMCSEQVTTIIKDTDDEDRVKQEMIDAIMLRMREEMCASKKSRKRSKKLYRNCEPAKQKKKSKLRCHIANED